MKTLLFIDRLPWVDPILPDVVIDYWGDIFLDNPRLRGAGIDFETFLQAPARILAAVIAAPIAPERIGLLPVQRAVRRRIDFAAEAEQIPLALEHTLVALECDGARVSDGRWVEKLRHNAYPRHAPKRTVLEA